MSRPLVERWIAGLLLLTTLTPIVAPPGFLYPFVVPRAVFFRTIVEVASALLAYLVLTRQATVSGRDPVLWAMGAFAGVNLISAAVGFAPVRSVFGDIERMWGLFTWFHLLLYYLLLRSVLDDAGWRRFLRATFGVACLASAVALVEANAYRFHFARWGNVHAAAEYRVASLLGNTGYLAAYLVLTLGVTAFLRSRTSGKRGRALYSAGFLLQAAALLLTRGRAVFLALVVAALWSAIILGQHRRAPARRAILTGLGLLTGIALLTIWPPATHLLLRAPVVDRLAGHSWSEDIRFQVWGAGMASFREHPLLGVGMENAYRIQSLDFDPAYYAIPGASTVIFDRFHSAYLEVLAASGALGLLAYIGIWAGFLYALVLARRRARLSRGELTLLSAALVGYLAYLGFWFEEWNAFPLALALAAFTGSLAGRAPPIRFGAPLHRSRMRTILLATGIAAIVGLALDRYGFRVLRASHYAAAALNDSTLAGRMARFEQALSLHVVGGAPLLYRFSDELQHVESDPASLRRAPERMAAVDAALRTALRADEIELTREPGNDLLYSVRARLHLASLRLHRDGPSYLAAVADARRAIALTPRQLPNYHLLANIQIAGGHSEDALVTLEAAREVYAGLGETALLTARASLARRRPEEAARWTRQTFTAPDRRAPARFVLIVGSALEKDGNRSAAQALYRAYLQSLPSRSLVPHGATASPPTPDEKALREIRLRDASSPATSAPSGRRRAPGTS